MSTTRINTIETLSSASSECGSVSTIAFVSPAPVLSSPSSYWDLDNVEALTLSREDFEELAKGAEAPRRARAALEWIKAEESSSSRCSNGKHPVLNFAAASANALLELKPYMLKHLFDSSKVPIKPREVAEVLQATRTLDRVSQIDMATLNRYADYQRSFDEYGGSAAYGGFKNQAATAQARSFLSRLIFATIYSTPKLERSQKRVPRLA